MKIIKRLGLSFALSLGMLNFANAQFVSTGNSSNTGNIWYNGKVGIGTNAPGSALEVKTGNVWNGTIRANSNLATDYSSFALYANNSLKWAMYQHPGLQNTLLFANAEGKDKIAFTQDGKMGIGTLTPGSALEVKSDNIWNGTIRANSNLDTDYSSFALYANNSLKWAMYQNPGLQNTLLFANAEGKDKIAFTQDGKMGIGTLTPGSALEVKSDNIWNGTIRANSNLDTDYSSFALYANNSLKWAMYQNPGLQNTLLFANAEGKDKIAFTQDGKMGIGTITPDADAMLTVAGKANAREIKVHIDAGKDIVFQNDYALMPLEEVEAFIKKNKHLPEVAPARIMEKEGLELGKFNMTLLQKVEELTLHTIQLKKEKDQLKKENAKKDAVIAQILKRLEALEQKNK